MSTHTQGRLRVTHNSWEVSTLHCDGIAVARVHIDSDVDERTQQHLESVKEANASRLAACWNLCESVPTEDMEGKTLDEYVIQQAFITGMNPSPEGMGLGVKGLAAQMTAASFAGQFIGNGAVNYLEMRFSHPDVGPFTVTIQRTQGLTPAQKLKQVEEQRDELLGALKDVRGDLFMQIESKHGARAASEYPSIVRAKAAIANSGCAA